MNKHEKLIIGAAVLWLLLGLVLFALTVVTAADEQVAGKLEKPDISMDRAVAMPEIELNQQVKPLEIEEFIPDEAEMEMLAKMVWGEARGCTETEQAAVVWTVFNRVDDERFPDSIAEVVTAKNQFVGYAARNPVTEEIHDMCVEVYNSWQCEKQGVAYYRELPREYVFFSSDGNGHNVFRTEYRGGERLWIW